VKHPRIDFGGLRFYRNAAGYYMTAPCAGEKQKYLHRAIYESVNGQIQARHHIHHIDENRQNNLIENLQCLSEAEHKRLHFKEVASVYSEAAAKWHGSEAGRKWHAAQAKAQAHIWRPVFRFEFRPDSALTPSRPWRASRPELERRRTTSSHREA